MNKLTNNFSLLELDVADAEDHLKIAAADAEDHLKIAAFDTEDHLKIAAFDAENHLKIAAADAEDHLKIAAADAEDHLKIAAADDSNTNGDQQTLESAPVNYKMPLVWIDLEMTGLNIENDRILEIACVITDGNLTKSIEGPDLVIHQTKECLDKMGEWCQEHHSASGLMEKVLQSSITEQDAEKQVMEFVKRHVGTYTPLIAGNSIYTDLLFLKKYMPNLAGLFSHILVDVSSVKALCVRWYPRDKKKAPQKENNHRAMDDIKESIAELKFYKDHIFKHKSNK